MANRLALELVADANGLLKTMDQVQRQLSSFVKSSESAGQALGGGVNRALDAFEGLAKGGAAAAGILAGGIFAAAGAATALVASAGRQAEALEQTSQKTGIAVGTLQGWTVAMAQSGIGMDSLTRGVKTLSDQIVQSHNPNSQATERFNALGITARSVDGVLEQLADRFDMMPDGADKTRIAVELFGKAGQDLIPILNKGSVGLRESLNASKALGAVLADDTVKSLAAADDAFDTLGVATRAASSQLAGLLAPAVTSVTESFTRGVGVVATFFGALNEGSKGGENTLQFLKTLNPLIQKLGGPGFNVEAMEKQAKDMAAFGEATKQLHDELIEKLEAEGRVQEDMGKRILVDLLAKWRSITAEMKAQEQLGRNVNAIAENERKERNAAFGRELQQQEELNNQRFGPAVVSDGMAKHQAAVENLIRLMPELNHQEAALQVLFNQQSAHDSIVAATDAYKDRNKELELAVAYARADFQLQQAWYAQAPGLIDATNHVRSEGFQLIEAEGQLQRQMIDQTIFDEERKAAAILALDMETMNRRRQIISQYPTFWEQQLQAIVASNAFSLSSITSSFNNATAQWIQGKGTFDDFILQSQTTLLTSALQFTEQWLAQLAIGQSRELGLSQAWEAAKLALGISTEAERTAAAVTGSEARVAIAEAEAGATNGIMTGVSAAFEGMVGVVQGVTFDMATSIIEALLATWTFTKAVLGSIAAALKATVFGIPVGYLITAALVAGSVMVMEASKTAGIALGVLAAGTFALTAFADGGIVTGPTVGMMGEAGSPEAAIPLNDRGAAFMQKTMGLGGGGGAMAINLYLDGRQIAQTTMQQMPGVYRLKMGNR